MSPLRAVAERSILFVLLVCRIALMALGLAFLTTSLMVSGLFHELGGPASALGWIRATGALLLAGAIALFVSRSWIRIPRSAVAGPQGSPPAWLPLLPASMLAQAVCATIFSSSLVALWRDAVAFLDRVGVWKELWSGRKFSGLILAPVFALLLVPLLEIAAAFFLAVAPVLLVSLYLMRSRAFPRAFVMISIAQIALVGASLFSAHAFALLAVRVVAREATASGAELRAMLETLRRIQDVIWPTARVLCWLLTASIMWLPAMFRSRRMAPFFNQGSFEIEPERHEQRSGPRGENSR